MKFYEVSFGCWEIYVFYFFDLPYLLCSNRFTTTKNSGTPPSNMIREILIYIQTIEGILFGDSPMYIFLTGKGYI